MEAVKWLNEQRAVYGIKDYLMFAALGFGYQEPGFLALYTHVSQEEYNSYFESTPDAYKEKFQEYLDKILKLMVEPPNIYHYSILRELSYSPEGE